jgi:arylsulfatase
MTNLRQDPFERTSMTRGETFNTGAGGYINDFMAREFWRFVVVQKAVFTLAQTAVEFPPMQSAASFNLDAVKKQIEEMIKAHEAQ